MLILEITEQERADGAMTMEHREAAIKAVREDGFVVLTNAVSLDHLAILRERMLGDLETILARPDAPFNFNTGNVQQDPPPFPPYLFKDILLNDMAIAVTKGVLGAGVKNSFYSGNTALPGGTRQPVHPDVAQLWPDLPQATPAFGLVVNIPLVDVSVENGSTEIWPGTHLDTRYSISQGSLRIPEDVLNARRAIVPPIQPTIPVGSIVIRDIRLWHAGTPNHTQMPRPMIAMIHWISWWTEGSVTFPQSAEDFLKHPDLTTVAHFVDGPVDYLHHNEAYDLQK